MSDNDPPLVECHGGPWDGPLFPVNTMVEAHVAFRRSRDTLDHYYRRRDGYHWQPTLD
jgi:hypothetical protein